MALSDILSHEHLFMTNIPTITITTVRSFINQIITKIILPPTQHYKIMRYLIIESIHAKYYNLYHNVPIELKKLLINAVLYPGYDKISILPIISTILSDDPLLGVFNNPKFPPLPKYINLVNNIEDEVEEPIKEELTTPLKKRKLDIESNEETDNNNIIPVEDQSKIFTATKVEKLTTTTTSSIENNPVVIEELTSSKEIVVESPVDEPTKVDNIIPTTTTTTTTTTSLTSNTANANDDNDNDDDDESSDFEMPEINLDQDSDDE